MLAKHFRLRQELASPAITPHVWVYFSGLQRRLIKNHALKVQSHESQAIYRRF